MKRVLSVFVVLAMLLTLSPLTVADVSPYYLEATQLETNGCTLNANGTVTVEVSLKGVPTDLKFSSLQFNVLFDSSELTLIGYDENQLLAYTNSGTTRAAYPTSNTDDSGYYYAIAQSYGMSRDNEVLAILNFAVADGVAYDTVCDLTFSNLEFTLTPTTGTHPVAVEGFYGVNGYIKVNPTVDFFNGTTLIDTVGYASGATSVTEPAVPAVQDGYTAAWPTDYALPINGGTDVALVISPITYTAQFVDSEGELVGEVAFTVESTVAQILAQAPSVPNIAGYQGAWETFEIAAADLVIEPVYTPITYVATFVNENGVSVGTVGFTVDSTAADVLLQAPAVPSKDGYTGVWESFTLTAANITIRPVYTPITYTAQFVDSNDDLVGEVAFTVESTVAQILAQAPSVPNVAGYQGAWETFEIAAADLVIEPVYTPITYAATFVNESGATIKTVNFTVESTVAQILAQAPSVPDKSGYNGVWEDFEITASNITIRPVYTLATYTASYVDYNGMVLHSVNFTIESTVAQILAAAPTVPDRTGYTGVWESFSIQAGNITIHPVYTPISYVATFVNEAGEPIGTVNFTVESTVAQILAQAPQVPDKAGFVGLWAPFTVVAENITVHPQYTTEAYTATFVDHNGHTVGTVTFTVQHTAEQVLAQAPDVPQRTGYTGVWESFEISSSNITVRPVYTPIIYTISFVADGVTIYSFGYSVESNLAIFVEPAVPPKDGFDGSWEAYTLDYTNRTVNAIYQQSASYLWGDANCDGAVDAADAAKILRSVVKLDSLSELGKIQGDVRAPYDEGAPDSADAAAILRWIVHLISRFDVEDR
ncbi:MAG: cohesin domain-containing protein [Eubacteriales bacterium]|nr:cohesin domain-containing protein [Eubacteriales bacterium]